MAPLISFAPTTSGATGAPMCDPQHAAEHASSAMAACLVGHPRAGAGGCG